MLAGVAEELTSNGWHVVLPSRRYSPIAAVAGGPGAAARASLRRPGHRPDADEPGGRALWVEADWTQPVKLAEDAGRALDGPADLMVAWVHTAYRRPVFDAVASLLAGGAPVVDVRSHSSAGAPVEDLIPPLPGHPVQDVVLGYGPGSGRARWLTHAEIVEGVLTAVRRALAGRPPSSHHIGRSRP